MCLASVTVWIGLAIYLQRRLLVYVWTRVNTLRLQWGLYTLFNTVILSYNSIEFLVILLLLRTIPRSLVYAAVCRVWNASLDVYCPSVDGCEWWSTRTVGSAQWTRLYGWSREYVPVLTDLRVALAFNTHVGVSCTTQCSDDDGYLRERCCRWPCPGRVIWILLILVPRRLTQGDVDVGYLEHTR